nr:GNAT family N-acetyltransferase [Oscillatoria sp. FACHB-1406]
MIQTAKIEQFPAIAQLNIEAYRQYSDRLSPENRTTLQTNLRSVEKVAERAVFLIAMLSDELVASVAYCSSGNSLAPIPSDWASVLLLAVSPHHRRQGIARALLRVCIDRATQDKAKTIGLFTSELMTDATQLYLSVGFERDCEIPPRLGLYYWRYKLDLSALESSV